MTTTVDCGSKDCFQEKFSSCQKATLQATAPIASVHYEIIAPAEGGCKMKFKYLTNPNPNWVNKDLICVYSDRKDFEAAIQDMLQAIINKTKECEGPLVDVLLSS